MTVYLQAERALTVTTPLAKDALLLVGFTGQEGISQLFHFQLDLLAENTTDVPFDRLLGQKVTVNLALGGGKFRYFNGICSRVLQGERSQTFTAYQMEIVPQLWLLTRRVQSRIFQHQSVPDILKKVLTGIDGSLEPQGTFHPRDYCVQYRESDFAFASRLMEEEGIYYFFKHTSDGHKMVLANTPQSHPDLPGGATLTYEKILGGSRDEDRDDRVFEWLKTQELRSGKVTLWDHSFELPHKHLEAEKPTQESVAAGKVTHKLKVGGNDRLEIYDYPGEYANRVDGVDKGGGDKPDELTSIFSDNKRTVGIRMQEEALAGLRIRGSSNCRNLVSGYKFTLDRHFNADGPYVLVSVEHTAKITGSYRSEGGAFHYNNTFSCIPLALPFRPPRVTPRPTVKGTQTAVVVGDGEIAPDKYGRVKVQLHWDREGKNNAGSSCWVRVATPWAGKQWGMVHIPRVGQEVIVDFLEGNPDNPIIIGSVYNADQMPPYALPANKTQSGIKSRSSPGGGAEDFNEICFEDKKGSELLYIRAQKDQHSAVENDEAHWVGHDREKEIDHDEKLIVHHDRNEFTGNDRSLEVIHDKSEKIGNNKTIAVKANHTETIGGDMSQTVYRTKMETIALAKALSIGGAYQVSVGAAMNETVVGAKTEEIGAFKGEAVGGSKSEGIGGTKSVTTGKDLILTVGKNQTVTVTNDVTEKVGGKHTTEITKEYALNAKKIQLMAEDQIVLKTGDAEIVMKKNGDITITGKKITVKGSGDVVLKGSKILEN